MNAGSFDVAAVFSPSKQIVISKRNLKSKAEPAPVESCREQAPATPQGYCYPPWQSSYGPSTLNGKLTYKGLSSSSRFVASGILRISMTEHESSACGPVNASIGRLGLCAAAPLEVLI